MQLDVTSTTEVEWVENFIVDSQNAVNAESVEEEEEVTEHSDSEESVEANPLPTSTQRVIAREKGRSSSIPLPSCHRLHQLKRVASAENPGLSCVCENESGCAQVGHLCVHIGVPRFAPHTHSLSYPVLHTLVLPGLPRGNSLPSLFLMRVVHLYVCMYLCVCVCVCVRTVHLCVSFYHSDQRIGLAIRRVLQSRAEKSVECAQSQVLPRAHRYPSAVRVRWRPPLALHTATLFTLLRSVLLCFPCLRALL
jgi:hypothetical protein